MSRRPIDVAGYRTPAPAPTGPVPQLQWVAIADLVVDDRYQRPLRAGNRKAIQRIADAFNWSQFSPVLVAPVEGGRFAIIDGQHRATAAFLRGFETVPCQVVLADEQQQAAAFAAVNGKVQKVTSLQLFHAAKEAGEDWATAVASVCAEAGVTIARYPMPINERSKKRETMAVRVIDGVIRQRGRAIAVVALRCIMESALRDDPACLGALWISAIGDALGERPALAKDLPWLIRFFDDVDTDAVRAEAAKLRLRGYASVSEAVAVILRDRLDRRRPEAA